MTLVFFTSWILNEHHASGITRCVFTLFCDVLWRPFIVNSSLICHLLVVKVTQRNEALEQMWTYRHTQVLYVCGREGWEGLSSSNIKCDTHKLQGELLVNAWFWPFIQDVLCCDVQCLEAVAPQSGNGHQVVHIILVAWRNEKWKLSPYRVGADDTNGFLKGKIQLSGMRLHVVWEQGTNAAAWGFRQQLHNATSHKLICSVFTDFSCLAMEEDRTENYVARKQEKMG